MRMPSAQIFAGRFAPEKSVEQERKNLRKLEKQVNEIIRYTIVIN